MQNLKKIHEVSVPVDITGEGVTLLCVLRDEAWRLPEFFAHYRRLGICRFVFIDNNSCDGTREYLLEQEGVALYSGVEQFNKVTKEAWIARAIELHGYNRWYLCVDADEMLAYDGMELHTLDELCALALAERNERIQSLFVDMYGPGSFQEHATLPDYPAVLRYCRLFDRGPYTIRVGSARVSATGGIRARFFGSMGCSELPELAKYPLFYARKGDVRTGAHHMSPVWRNFLSRPVLALLHYKFSAPDCEKISVALREGQYDSGSLEYHIYARWLERHGDEVFLCPESLEYEGVDSLVRAGIVDPIAWGDPHATTYPFFSPESWRDRHIRRRFWNGWRKRLFSKKFLKTTSFGKR